MGIICRKRIGGSKHILERTAYKHTIKQKDNITTRLDDAHFFCSAAAIYYADIEKVNDYARNMTCRPFMVIDWYHPWAMKIETVTWMEVIKKLQELIPCDKKVGIVIDSELGNLEGYNNRTVPVFGEWYLPDNYTFMYATANTSDEWCNKMIRQCDKAATQRLAVIVNSPRLTVNPSGGNAPHRFYFSIRRRTSKHERARKLVSASPCV